MIVPAKTLQGGISTMSVADHLMQPKVQVGRSLRVWTLTSPAPRITRSRGDSFTTSDQTAAMNHQGLCQRPWVPAVGTSWQIVLNAPLHIDPRNPAIAPDVEAYTIDVFDNSAETVAALHSLGKKVIGYFSAGTYEEWRPDANQFPKPALGKPMDDWPGERWLDLKSESVRNIMANRIRLAAEKGFDAIDPDNVDGYSNKNGLGLKKGDSIDFIRFLSSEASKYGLSIGLKNAGEIIPQVIDHVHFQVNEECVKYNEGRTFEAFIKAGKAVFHIEYPKGAPGSVSDKSRASISKAKGTEHFTTVLKTMDLCGWVQFCDGQQFKTNTLKE